VKQSVTRRSHGYGVGFSLHPAVGPAEASGNRSWAAFSRKSSVADAWPARDEAAASSQTRDRWRDVTAEDCQVASPVPRQMVAVNRCSSRIWIGHPHVFCTLLGTQMSQAPSALLQDRDTRRIDQQGRPGATYGTKLETGADTARCALESWSGRGGGSWGPCRLCERRESECARGCGLRVGREESFAEICRSRGIYTDSGGERRGGPGSLPARLKRFTRSGYGRMRASAAPEC
jgi:hypothetical protein